MHEDKWRIMDGTICADIFETEELAKVRADRKKNIIGETPKGVEDGIGEGNTKSPIGS